MRTIKKIRRVGKGESAVKSSFDLVIAETQADVAKISAERGSFKQKIATETYIDVDYATYCFNYGHDLVTRSAMSESASVREQRAKAIAWVTTQPGLMPALLKVQLQAAATRKMDAVDAWADAIYADNEEEIEEFVAAQS